MQKVNADDNWRRFKRRGNLQALLIIGSIMILDVSVMMHCDTQEEAVTSNPTTSSRSFRIRRHLHILGRRGKRPPWRHGHETSCTCGDGTRNNKTDGNGPEVTIGDGPGVTIGGGPGVTINGGGATQQPAGTATNTAGGTTAAGMLPGIGTSWHGESSDVAGGSGGATTINNVNPGQGGGGVVIAAPPAIQPGYMQGGTAYDDGSGRGFQQGNGQVSSPWSSSSSGYNSDTEAGAAANGQEATGVLQWPEDARDLATAGYGGSDTTQQRGRQHRRREFSPQLGQIRPGDGSVQYGSASSSPDDTGGSKFTSRSSSGDNSEEHRSRGKDANTYFSSSGVHLAGSSTSAAPRDSQQYPADASLGNPGLSTATSSQSSEHSNGGTYTIVVNKADGTQVFKTGSWEGGSRPHLHVNVNLDDIVHNGGETIAQTTQSKINYDSRSENQDQTRYSSAERNYGASKYNREDHNVPQATTSQERPQNVQKTIEDMKSFTNRNDGAVELSVLPLKSEQRNTKDVLNLKDIRNQHTDHKKSESLSGIESYTTRFVGSGSGQNFKEENVQGSSATNSHTIFVNVNLAPQEGTTHSVSIDRIRENGHKELVEYALEGGRDLSNSTSCIAKGQENSSSLGVERIEASRDGDGSSNSDLSSAPLYERRDGHKLRPVLTVQGQQGHLPLSQNTASGSQTGAWNIKTPSMVAQQNTPGVLNGQSNSAAIPVPQPFLSHFGGSIPEPQKPGGPAVGMKNDGSQIPQFSRPQVEMSFPNRHETNNFGQGNSAQRPLGWSQGSPPASALGNSTVTENLPQSGSFPGKQGSVVSSSKTIQSPPKLNLGNVSGRGSNTNLPNSSSSGRVFSPVAPGAATRIPHTQSRPDFPQIGGGTSISRPLNIGGSAGSGSMPHELGIGEIGAARTPPRPIYVVGNGASISTPNPLSLGGSEVGAGILGSPKSGANGASVGLPHASTTGWNAGSNIPHPGNNNGENGRVLRIPSVGGTNVPGNGISLPHSMPGNAAGSVVLQPPNAGKFTTAGNGIPHPHSMPGNGAGSVVLQPPNAGQFSTAGSGVPQQLSFGGNGAGRNILRPPNVGGMNGAGSVPNPLNLGSYSLDANVASGTPRPLDFVGNNAGGSIRPPNFSANGAGIPRPPVAGNGVGSNIRQPGKMPSSSIPRFPNTGQMNGQGSYEIPRPLNLGQTGVGGNFPRPSITGGMTDYQSGGNVVGSTIPRGPNMGGMSGAESGFPHNIGGLGAGASNPLALNLGINGAGRGMPQPSNVGGNGVGSTILKPPEMGVMNGAGMGVPRPTTNLGGSGMGSGILRPTIIGILNRATGGVLSNLGVS